MNDLITKLTQIRDIDFTALDYESIQEELLAYIRTAATNNGIQDDFLQGDAAKMFIDLTSYLGDLLAFRIDTRANETYLSTARRRQSIINILELVGQRPSQPTAATVTVTAIPQTTAGRITIPARYSIPVIGLDGQPATFEIMAAADDYFSNVNIPAGVTNYQLTAYSGRYASFETPATGRPSFTVTLPSSPVIEGSIQVSVIPAGVAVSTESIISNRVRQVETLVDAEDEIIYKVRFNENGVATLTFSTERFGSIPASGDTVHVDYRVGGGARTNVGVGAINVSASFSDTSGTPITVQLVNPDTVASGGEDAQDIEDIRLQAPGLVSANGNLVTVADYEATVKDIAGVQDCFAVDAFTDDNTYEGEYSVPDNSVYLWVLPSSGGEVSPDLRQKIAARLESGRLTAIENFIFNPVYENWTLNANIKVFNTYDPLEVRAEVTEALLAAFGSEVASFDNSVRRSKVISTMQNVAGVDYVELNEPTSDLGTQENSVLRLLPTNISISIL